MIKTSGYRISPTEIEELVFETGLVSEVAAVGVPHDRLGQAIVIVAKPASNEKQDDRDIIDRIRGRVPNYMVPHAVEWKESLPRNANSKIDRKLLSAEYADLFRSKAEQK
jgi:acyl-CoA synthetase (AMP-forming)/AMP-acid ligase II